MCVCTGRKFLCESRQRGREFCACIGPFSNTSYVSVCVGPFANTSYVCVYRSLLKHLTPCPPPPPPQLPPAGPPFPPPLPIPSPLSHPRTWSRRRGPCFFGSQLTFCPCRAGIKGTSGMYPVTSCTNFSQLSSTTRTERRY